MGYCLIVIVLGLVWLGIETNWLKIELPLNENRLFKINWKAVKYWTYISSIVWCAGLTLLWTAACWYYMTTGTPVYFTFNVVNEGWVECFLFPTLAVLSFMGAVYFGENVNLNKPKVDYHKRKRIVNELIGV